MWIRSQVDETPAFRKVRESGTVVRLPIVEVLRNHWRAVLVAIGAKAAETGPFYIFGTYVIAYVTNVLDVRNNVVLGAVALAAIVATIWMPIFGRISDRIPRALLYRVIAALTIAYAFPYYLILGVGSELAVVVATVIGFGFLWGSVNAILGTLIAESFSPEIRYSGATLGYQLGAAIFGGTAPLIATALTAASGGAWWPVSIYVIVCASLGLLASFFVRRVAHRD